MSEKLLEVLDLKINFSTSEGKISAVDGISFYINPGETLGVVGESGCGKSVTAMSIMQLLPTPPAEISQGQILFQGENLLTKNRTQMREVNGNNISMIFQEPMTSLNPVITIGEQIMEPIRIHKKLKKNAARQRAVELLNLVGIPAAERRLIEYPHQLSGGMRQRIMIAIALACNPKLLIADEPTTALDVTIQAQIMELIKKLKDEFGMAVMLITHDLGVIAEIAQRIVVMYAGKVVEEGEVGSIFHDPQHPYTQGLINCVPNIKVQKKRLYVINGTVPNPLEMPGGCRFAPRCSQVRKCCVEKEPSMVVLNDGRRISCWLHGGNLRKAATS